ncbi:DUF3558 domain-containing protein [Rhodococcus opacus]|uniref:DUF3558 domain-containing protein n=1 Tax=Rhodococcus opacus TaxID=37919 RepID=UPI001F519B97|nr:DUF3558 domain-containing protein [Rhodococcus opacus]UNM99700.1 DUF3558 domain-containing protein [Rhodococcus opacus]UZG54498.1 DUF3558 domain-containing protein [Rhodococcus opacus]
MMHRSTLRIFIALTTLALTGCSTATGDGRSNPETTSASTTARVPRHVDQSDRPQVIFDPCLDIPDSAIVEAGYDAASEENADFTPAEYTFLGCTYDTPQRLYGLNVLSGNISFEEERQKVQSTQKSTRPIEINGRPALLEFDSGKPDVCAVSMETSSGFVILDRNLFKGTGAHAPEPEWCAGLEDTARIFERYIPKEG